MLAPKRTQLRMQFAPEPVLGIRRPPLVWRQASSQDESEFHYIVTIESLQQNAVP